MTTKPLSTPSNPTTNHGAAEALPNNHTAMGVFRLRDLFATQRLLWLAAWMLGLVTVLATVGLLVISGWFLSAAAFAGMVALGSQSFNYLVPAAVIRVMAMARTAGRYGELMVSHHAVFGLLEQLRVKFFRQFATLLPWQLPTHLRSAFTMHRLTHDIDVLDEFALRVVSPWWVAVVTSLLLTVCVVSVLTPLAPHALWLCAVAVLLLVAALIVPLLTVQKGISQAREQQQLAEQRRVTLIEPLSALTHLVLWRRWDSEMAKFDGVDHAYHAQLRHHQTVRGSAMLLMQWLLFAVIVLILYGVGQTSPAALAAAGLSIPMVLAMVLGIMGLTEIVLPLAQNYMALGNSVAAKNRLNELFSEAHLPTLSPQSMTPKQSLNAISAPLLLKVDSLTAKQPQAITHFLPVSFEVGADQPLLITGVSGAGKSTLLQVLANELLPLSGQVWLNGQDLSTLSFDNDVGYLAQQIDIFDQTLAQNLRLGKAAANDDELWQVLKKVGLDKWASQQPSQLDTRLGEYGMAVSGGQARRIALARLLLSPKKILLLDEPFAGLNDDDRRALWQTLLQTQQNGLLIVVTHHQWEDMGQARVLNLQVAV